MTGDAEGAGAGQIHLPAGENWTCCHSGVCCRAFDTIPVDDATAERLRGLDVSGCPGAGRGAMCGADLLLPPAAAGSSFHLKQHDDRRCVFLGADSLCELHTLAGPDAKPQSCRDFPFLFRETPTGVYVGLSFVCRAVRDNHGIPVTDQRDALSAALGQGHDRVRIGDTVRLTRRLEVSWAQYLSIETALLEILAIESDPFPRRLIAAHVWLNMIDMYWQALHGPFPPGADANRLTDSELEDFIAAGRGGEFRDPRRVAARKAGSRLVRRMFLGMITSFGNALWAGGGRRAVTRGVTFQYLRHAVSLGGVRLQPFPASVPHSELARMTLPERGPAAGLVDRYVRHAIFRKDLVTHFPVWKGLSVLLLGCALIPWYAAAAAASDGRKAPGDEDFSEAVRCVELIYGCHSKFARFLAGEVRLDDVVESFFLRRNYPFVLHQTD